jgi:hypothetical protein
MSISNDINSVDLIENKDHFLKYENFLSCAICEGFLIEPLECTKCQTNYCKGCLNTWNGNCPKKCGSKNYTKVHRITSHSLDLLTIKCSKCTSLVNYSGYLDHINDKCDYAKVECTNEGCTDKIEKIYLLDHLNKCNYTILECPGCDSLVHKRKIKFTNLADQSLILSHKEEIEKLKFEIIILKEDNKNLLNRLNESNRCHTCSCTFNINCKFYKFENISLCQECLRSTIKS